MASEDGKADRQDVSAWRGARRAALVSQREAVAEPTRHSWDERISAHLASGFEIPPETIAGFCWPYRSEYDARALVGRWREHAVVAALPEVIGRNTPLQFRKWWPGAPMRRGAFDIPVADGTEVVVPDILIVPMNGFDGRGFRLGYGGGYFDRTIGALERRVVTIGVAYELAAVETVHPHSHDAPMDFVVTENGIRVAGGAPLSPVDAEESRKCFAALLAVRRLPRATSGSGAYSSPVCYASEFPEYFGGDDRHSGLDPESRS